jgi:hypothetical protein
MEVYNAAWMKASQGIESDDDDDLLSRKPKVTNYNGRMLKNAGIPHTVFLSAK